MLHVEQHAQRRNSQWWHIGVARWEVDVKHKQASLIRRVLRATDDAAHLQERQTEAAMWHLLAECR
jgi:hypothetical protein